MKDQISPKTLLFGGSFDPPHPAHLQLPFQVAKKVQAQQLTFIPCADPPMDKGRSLSPAVHRLKMLKLALEDYLNHAEHLQFKVEINDLEIQRGGRSYSIDTVKHFRDLYPDSILHLLMGTDQLLKFEHWKDWEEIEKIASPLVMCRPPHDMESQIRSLPEHWDEPRRQSWIKRMIPVSTIDISSSLIREAVTRGDQDLSKLGLSEAVLSYIDQHSLYTQT